MYWFLNFLGLLRVVTRRQRSYSSLVLALAAGFVVAIAIVVSIPLYADMIGYRALRTELQPDAQGARRPPFAFLFSHVDSNTAPLPDSAFRAADAYFANAAARDVGLPSELLVRYVNTDKLQARSLSLADTPGVQPMLVNVGFASDIDDKIALDEGEVPRPAPANGVVDVMVHRLFADRTGVQVGEVLEVASSATSSAPFQLEVRVVGVWRALNPDDRYWFLRPESLEDVLLVPEQTFATRVQPQGANARAQTLWYMVLDGSRVRNADVPGLLHRITVAQRAADRLVPGIQMPVSPRQGLERQYERVRLLTVSLVVFSLPILGVIAYFVVMVAGMVVQRQQNEIAVLRSRGASRSEVIGIYLLEGLLVGAVTLAVGLLVGRYAATLMGWTRSFMLFAPRSDVVVAISRDGVRGGFWIVLLTIVASVLPALGAAGHTVISYKQERARSIRRPFWQRTYLDLLLLLPTFYAYQQLRDRGTISVLGRGLAGGDPFTNPLLVLAPALCQFTLALLSLRLFPLLMSGIAWLIGRLPGISALLALRYLTRSPRAYAGPVLLLILTLSLATFTASMARTLDDHLADQIYYQVGADIRVADLGQDTQAPTTPGEAPPPRQPGDSPRWLFLPVTEYLKLPGVLAASRVTRGSGEARTADHRGLATVIGVDRMDFPAVAHWRDDYATQSLGGLMNALATDPAAILASRAFLSERGLGIGDRVTIELRDLGVPAAVPFTIAGVTDYFPSVYPEDGPFFVANADYLFEQQGDVFPYEVWLDVTPETTPDQIRAGIAELRLPSIISQDAPETILAAQNRPERQGLYGLLSVGFLASALLTGLGFLFYSLVSFQRRFIELGMLRAIGLSARQMAVLLLCEQALIIAIGITTGTAIGVGVSRLFIPFLQVREGPHAQTPPFVVQIAWEQVQLIYLIFAVLLGLALAGVVVLLLRMKIFQAVKLGEAA
jgi:putative ABC transport system permease protein